MTFRLLLPALALLLAVPAGRQESKAGSPLASLVDTERAFSSMSVAQGTRAAFLAFFADDGVSFGPAPANTKASLGSQPASAKSAAIILEWAPITADVARSGDLGYTTGPWVRTERTEARKPIAWGWYFTVWKKQADGSWKAAADIGTSSPPHALPRTDAFRAAGAGDPAALSEAPAQAADAAGILAAEKAFSDRAAGGALDAYLACAAVGFRLHRNGSEPFVGTEAVKSVLADKPARTTSQPIKADVSRSGDLGYAYGSYVSRPAGPGVSSEERGYYLRVWKRISGAWRLVADISNLEPAGTTPH